MKKSIIYAICMLMFVFGSVFLPTVNAETFDIGEKMQSDLNSIKYFSYTSGAVIETDPDLVNLFPSILDGNLSTGIDINKEVNNNELYFRLLFIYPLYVNNITIKPKFGNGSSSFSLSISLFIGSLKALTGNSEITYQINGPISGFILVIFPNGTNQFYFNDVIINYTPSSLNLEGIQKQINKINQDINSIYNDIIVLKNDIIEIKENITNIKNNMPSEYNDSALQDQINNLTQEINSLKENLTRINNSIPSKYNDSSIKSNIFSLETENVFLKQQIGNLTIKINNLTTELEKLSSEVQNLQGVGGDKTNDTEQNYRIHEYTYTIIFGVIIIILLLIILKLSLIVLKRKPHEVEKPKPDDILISKIKYDILTNKEIKDSRLYDDEYKRLLENGYRKGEMSPETYNYIKSVLEVSEKPQNKK